MTKPHCESVVNKTIPDNYAADHLIYARNIPDELWNFPNGFDEHNVYVSDFTFYINGTHQSFNDLSLEIIRGDDNLYPDSYGIGAIQIIYLGDYTIGQSSGTFDFGISNHDS